MSEYLEGDLATLRGVVELIDAAEYPKVGVPQGRGPHARPLRVTHTWGEPLQHPDTPGVYILVMKPLGFRHIADTSVMGRRFSRADLKRDSLDFVYRSKV